MNPIVDVRNVKKTFVRSGFWPWSPSTEVHAVQGVDLKVMPGGAHRACWAVWIWKTTLYE